MYSSPFNFDAQEQLLRRRRRAGLYQFMSPDRHRPGDEVSLNGIIQALKEHTTSTGLPHIHHSRGMTVYPFCVHSSTSHDCSRCLSRPSLKINVCCFWYGILSFCFRLALLSMQKQLLCVFTYINSSSIQLCIVFTSGPIKKGWWIMITLGAIGGLIFNLYNLASSYMRSVVFNNILVGVAIRVVYLEIPLNEK